MTDLKAQLKEIVEHQAKMQSLWALPIDRPITFSEAMLAAALRHLHAVIEGDELMAKAAKKLYWDLESEI